jgi:flagellar hook-associated protein 2
MGRIQSSIGLITGVPIQDTVNQLMTLAARPRELLAARNKDLQTQQTAIADLLAKTLALQLAAGRLGRTNIFRKNTATSSHPDLLSVAVTGEPTAGSYLLTPVRTAQTHQLLSGGFAAADQPIGEGSLSFRFGRVVNEAVSLDDLNDGAGVERGKIRITDRSGASAEIDLRFAHSIDDVLDAVNSSGAINVTASVSGDRILLTDGTGQSTSNLRVQEVGAGRTAADLGLASINTATATALGSDLLSLHAGTELASLNDGAGVEISESLADLEVTFRDSTTLIIDFDQERTLGEILQTINAADPARLKAEIAPDGDRLMLTDLSADNGGSFAVADPFGGETARKLGLTQTAAGGVITGARLLGGLKSSLLSSLGGGQGISLGLLDLTDRSGASATVDLSSAETMEHVAAAVNAAGLAITAQVNVARNGLVLTDTSGGPGNLIVANGDLTTQTAEKLNLAVDAAVASVNSGSLNLQVISRQTTLASLNGGKGVDSGSFIIYNSQGVARSFKPVASGVRTIGGLIEMINDAGFGVTARINEAGDGIALVDTVGGSQSLRVAEAGSGTAARDLHLLGTAVTATENGQPAQVLDGSHTVRVQIGAEDTLADLVAKINAAGAGVKASNFSVGAGAKPHRLSLLSDVAGTAGRLVVEGAGLQFSEAAAARDALVVFGANDAGQGLLITSPQNTFNDLIGGLSLTIKGASAEPVTVNVGSTDSDLVGAIKTFVEQYNGLVKKIDEYTFFNEAESKTGVLFGSHETLRIESDLGRLASGRIFGAGPIQSLAEVGVSIGDNGTLVLDEEKLKARFASDPQAVEQFFADEQNGVSARFHKLLESLAGANSSLLVDRNTALSRKVETNQQRIDAWTLRLDLQRERLLKQFYNMEAAIGKLQTNLTAINRIAPLPPLTARRSN